ncbi:MAG TPA: hypothetical protein VGO67_09885 [Verrucomicrobiae bacterium]|jgi:ABC-type transport system involved in multi-copper enzyme maturation permease subunit
MKLPPIVERELRVAARKNLTYWRRLLAALAGAGLVMWILSVSSTSGVTTGATVFRDLAVFVFVYAALSAILVTSDSISRERRESTLGLLFLTDLTGFDIVSGKLAATGINLFHAILAVLPVLAIVLPLGAVTVGEVFRVGIVAVNLLIFFSSVGLAASALCQRANISLALSFTFSCVMIALWPLAAQYTNFLHPTLGAALVSSPAYGCYLAFDLNYNSYFWLNTVFTLCYSGGLLAFACWHVPRSWQDSVAERNAAQTTLENAPLRDKVRIKLLAQNPYLWRASRPEFKRALVWLTLVVIAGIWAWLDRFQFRPFADVFALIFAGTVLKVWLAADASWTIAEDRRQGALELLLSTQLSAEQIVSGQRASLWRQFVGPVITLLAANFITLEIEIHRASSVTTTELVWLHVIAGGSLLLELSALSWVAIWQGLINRKSNRAVIWAMMRILATPYALFLAILFIDAFAGPPGSVDWTGLLIFPGILGAGANFFFALEANTKLLASFRTVVAEGYEPKRFADEDFDQEQVLAEVE